MIILVGVPTASVIYSGAKVISVYFAGITLVGLDLGNIAVGCWIIGILSAVYVFAGGLKACAWADLLQGSALIAGGAVVMVFALSALGAADPVALVQTAVTPGLDPAQLADAGAWERIRMLQRRGAARGQAAHGAARERPVHPVDGARRRPLDPELLLLGPEPVHHPAHAGRADAERGPARRRLRRLPQAHHPLHRRLPGDHGVQPVQRGHAPAGRREEPAGPRGVREGRGACLRVRRALRDDHARHRARDARRQREDDGRDGGGGRRAGGDRGGQRQAGRLGGGVRPPGLLAADRLRLRRRVPAAAEAGAEERPARVRAGRPVRRGRQFAGRDAERGVDDRVDGHLPEDPEGTRRSTNW